MTSAVEDYVLAVYRLWANGEPVQVTRIAEELKVAPASVTEALGRLRTMGLLAPGRRVELTEAGRRLARSVASRHRLVERFLVDVLGFGWDEVHDEAHRLEHALSPRVAERLDAFLGHPSTCPHGHPIMLDGRSEPDVPLATLGSLPPGSRAVVRRIAHEEGDLLRRLGHLGLVPGSQVEVVGPTPEGGLTVRLVDGVVDVDGATSTAVLVEVGAPPLAGVSSS